ncbi:hypothetical protein FA95DRAFT_915986 [Auriscalpium vulgare]|uniref:Uncharacterized protein n=1 Tax=Auriscalpium vulgare TaxID=40419 RepID=A0ACB8R948_9AGAM|nr:hypothetical protein FA95DRAFT_915986 [Auriscalpium vulgare]
MMVAPQSEGQARGWTQAPAKLTASAHDVRHTGLVQGGPLAHFTSTRLLTMLLRPPLRKFDGCSTMSSRRSKTTVIERTPVLVRANGSVLDRCINFNLKFNVQTFKQQVLDAGHGTSMRPWYLEAEAQLRVLTAILTVFALPAEISYRMD